jgi:protein-tyrosine phosphatase
MRIRGEGAGMSYPQSILDRETPVDLLDVQPASLLFICMGNICRSPTAVGVMRKKLAEAGLADHVTVDSAGTHDYRVGKPPDARAQAVAARRGYDLSTLRARQIDQSDFVRFDLLIAMDHGNLGLIKSMCPFAHRYKLRLMMDFAYRLTSPVVPDPFDGRIKDFELALDCIEDACTGMIAILTQTIALSR